MPTASAADPPLFFRVHACSFRVCVSCAVLYALRACAFRPTAAPLLHCFCKTASTLLRGAAALHAARRRGRRACCAPLHCSLLRKAVGALLLPPLSPRPRLALSCCSLRAGAWRPPWPRSLRRWLWDLCSLGMARAVFGCSAPGELRVAGCALDAALQVRHAARQCPSSPMAKTRAAPERAAGRLELKPIARASFAPYLSVVREY